MNLEESAEFTASYLKKKNLKFDIVIAESFSSSLQVFDKKISNIENENTRGLGLRVFKNQKPSYVYTEKLDKASIEKMVENALVLCEIGSFLEIDLPQPRKLPNIDLKKFNPDIKNFDWKSMKEMTLSMERLSYAHSSLVKNVPYSYAGKIQTKNIFINSNELFFQEKSNSIYLGVGIVAEKINQKKMGHYSRSGRNLENIIQSNEIAQESVNRSLDLLEARPIPSGKYSVLLSNLISPALFSSFCSIFYADLVQKSQSRLKGKLNQKISSSLLNLVCDPHNPEYPGASLFDGEGILTRKLNLIENGILKNFLYNLESAKKDGVSSTGNAQRSYSGKVKTGFSNFIIEKGQSSLEQLLNLYSKCFHIVQLGFNSASCNSISGEISIEAQGFLYERGEKKQAVDSVVLNINFFDLLQKIVGISNQYSDSFSSTKVPDILIEEVNIAGN